MPNTISPETIQQLEQKHRRVLHLRKLGNEAAFRPPTRAEYKKVKAELENDETKDNATEYLVLACCVHPERAEFDRMLDDYPGLVDSFGGELLKLVGLGQAEVVKK